MSTLAQRIIDLATRVATECKAVRTLVNGNAADLSALTTASKTSLVSAMNELKAGLSAIINDAALSNSTAATYSASKITTLISAATAALVASSPGTLDTLKELADALGDDPNFATTMSAALGNRVRVDTAAQGLNSTQQQNARTNINAYGSVELGNPDTDFVATFTAALV